MPKNLIGKKYYIPKDNKVEKSLNKLHEEMRSENENKCYRPWHLQPCNKQNVSQKSENKIVIWTENEKIMKNTKN